MSCKACNVPTTETFESTDPFVPFPKLSRLSRECVVTEKIDGTNAQIFVGERGAVRAASRTRWITPDNDNFGFARWVQANASELVKLGPGRHYGEWFGSGIQRGYNLATKRFMLFNSTRWCNHDVIPKEYASADPTQVRVQQNVPACVSVVPELYRGVFCSQAIANVLWKLSMQGSVASPGFMDPEGVVVFHTASGTMFKKTIKDDGVPKSAYRPNPMPMTVETADV